MFCSVQSHSLALAEACKVALEISPMPVRQIAFPTAGQPTWQHPPSNFAALDHPHEPPAVSYSVQPVGARAVHLSETAGSAAAGLDLHGVESAHTGQQDEHAEWQASNAAAVKASHVQAHRLAPAGHADVSAEPPAWRGDDVSAQGEQAAVWQQPPVFRTEPSLSSAGAGSLQPMSEPACAMMHVQQSYQPASILPVAGARAEPGDGPAMPECPGAEGCGPAGDNGWVGSHLRELGLAGALKPSEQPMENAHSLPADRHVSDAPTHNSFRMPPQPEEVQAVASISNTAVSAAELLLVNPRGQGAHTGAAWQPGGQSNRYGMAASEQRASADPLLDQEQPIPDRPAPASMYLLPAPSAPAAARQDQTAQLAQRGQQPHQDRSVRAADQGRHMAQPDEHAQLAAHDNGQAQGTVQQPTLPEQAAAASSSLGRAGAMQEIAREPALAGVRSAEVLVKNDGDKGDVAKEEGGGSGSESDSDEEAFPLGSGRLPLSLGGRLAAAGSSQRCAPLPPFSLCSATLSLRPLLETSHCHDQCVESHCRHVRSLRNQI